MCDEIEQNIAIKVATIVATEFSDFNYGSSFLAPWSSCYSINGKDRNEVDNFQFKMAVVNSEIESTECMQGKKERKNTKPENNEQIVKWERKCTA